MPIPDNAQHQEWKLGHDDIIRSLARLEAGQEKVIEGQRDMLVQQKLTNGHVRDLREWKAVHESEAATLANQHRDLANRIQLLMDAETTRLAVARDAAQREKRFFTILGIGAAVMGGIGGWILDLLTKLLGRH